jgi:hypothetical protein
VARRPVKQSHFAALIFVGHSNETLLLDAVDLALCTNERRLSQAELKQEQQRQ